MDALFVLKKFSSACTFIPLAMAILSISACTDDCFTIIDITNTSHNTTIKKAPNNATTGACIDAYVHVYGDLIPNSTAFLYVVPSLGFNDVMRTVHHHNSSLTFTVNESQEFTIPCLRAGEYAIMIPASSYNGSVGYPLPYETCTEKLSIDIAFQGGNYLYAIGAFAVLENNQTFRCENRDENFIQNKSLVGRL